MGSTDGFQYRALYPYRKEREEDIDLLPGDILVVSKGALQALGFKDGDEQTPNQIGWILGVNERTKQKGDFPGTYVEYVGPVKISVPSHRPRVQRPLPATPGASGCRLQEALEQGSPLPDLQEQFSPPEIAPPLLVKLVEAIEKKGLDGEMLYRSSGSELRQALRTDWTLGDLEPFDVHSLGEALRGYLQDLPSPVVPVSVHGDILRVLQEIPQPENCRKQLLLALESPAVPLQNTLTLQFLLRHLGKVSQQAESNSLHPRALGEIFGPLLLRLPGASPELSPDFSALFLEMLLQTKELEPEQLPPAGRAEERALNHPSTRQQPQAWGHAQTPQPGALGGHQHPYLSVSVYSPWILLEASRTKKSWLGWRSFKGFSNPDDSGILSLLHECGLTQLPQAGHAACTELCLSFHRWLTQKGARQKKINEWLGIKNETEDQYSMMDDEEELPHHEERTWYVGKINRLQAEEMLCGKRDGTFLIRESSQKGCYACSVVVDGDTKHCVIYKTATGYGFAEPYNLYASLKDLVLHYKHTSLVQHNDSLNVTLAHPVLSQPPAR
ncbi:phosphatidylinositol 3-kinase regulatory subunit beta [Athene cunicularia]|uniref:phosphatidylinositol 3-kinase regulatory subunit beta n=1 Tax=Athene cunicularia TaxID=194338 RepID=UPI000EF73593|nr:phosphatidylinositol 3-kinase regulatory subunit beta [Athene cunicularia]